MDEPEFQVLILKATPDDRDEEDLYVKALLNLKIPATVIPTLEFRYKNLDVLRECLSHPENYSGLLINSPRCAKSIIEGFRAHADVELLDKWKKLKCFTVGETSARLMADTLQLLPDGSSSGNMENLLQIVAQYSFEKPLLMPCGNLHKESTQEKNIKLDKVIVYETCEHAKLKDDLLKMLENNSPSLITFFSPSGVTSAIPYISKTMYPSIKFIAIGPTTAKELKCQNVPVCGVCEKPTPGSLCQTVLEVMKSKQITSPDG